MHVLDVNEIFWITFYTYDKIMELWWKNWPDAYALYTKLVKQSRIQQTNQTKSLNAFLREWLGRWDERLKKARWVLKQLWLIDDIIVRDNLGKISGHYVRVNFLINENKVRNACMTYDLSTEALNQGLAKPTSGQTDTNALSTKYINAWSIKLKDSSSSDSNESSSEEDTKSNSLNSKNETGESDVCARVATYEDIQEVITDDSYRVANNKLLKCIIKMCDLWYKLEKKEKDIKKLVDWIKEKAEIYNIKNPDWTIAQWTMLQIFDQWYEHWNVTWVSNHKNALTNWLNKRIEFKSSKKSFR